MRSEPGVIAVKKVSFSRGGKTVLKEIELTVGTNELIGLIGPNGAGKSTLLKLLAKLLIPAQGTILLEGRDLNGWDRRGLAKKVAYLSQRPSIQDPFPCREVVLLGRYAHLGRFERVSENDRRAAEGAMARTATTPLAERSITHLSGGELQRVLLARTVAQGAKLLLLDEPTANLDPRHQLGVMELVASLAQEERSVVMALHDLPLAARYCRRLVLISQGEIVADGPPQAVLTEENLRRVYGIEVEITTHPADGYPIVRVVSVIPEGR